MTKEKDEMHVVEENIDCAIEDLKGGFYWSATPQGYDYWENVVHNLFTIRRMK